MAVRYDADGEDHNRNTGLPSGTTHTVCLWLIVDVDRNTFSCPISIDAGTGNFVYLETEIDGLIMYLFEGDDAMATGPSVTLSVGTWFFIAWTRNGTGTNSGTLYWAAANTAALSSGQRTLSQSFTPTNLRIGESPWGGEWFNGRIAAVKIWDGVALTQAEIENERWQYLPHRTQNLNSFYPFLEGGSGAGAQQDFSGNGRDLSGGTNSATADGPPIAWRRGPSRMFIPVAAGGGSSIALDAMITGRGAALAGAQRSLGLSARSSGTTPARGATNTALAFASRLSGTSHALVSSARARALSGSANGKAGALAGAAMSRALSGSASGSVTTRSAANIARALTARTVGGARTLANTVISLALSVRSVGRSSVSMAFEGLGAITARVSAGARVVGSLVMTRGLSANASGQSASRASQNVTRGLSAISKGGSVVRGVATVALGFTARITAGGAMRAQQGVSRALSATVRNGALVRANLPPLFQEVVGIVRSLVRASMKRSPIVATGKVRIPIVVSAAYMIAKNVSLKGYVIGDDTEIAFELTDWPAGVVLSKAYFTMKKSLKDLDAAAIVQREITSTLSDQGKITANGSTGTATGYFLIRHQDAEWANVKPGGAYQFDISPITDQATVQTPVLGTISFVKGSTDKNS